MIKIENCKSCGAKIIKNPLWKGQEQGVPFSWDRIIWKNMFWMDAMSVIMFVIILFGTWAYMHDTAECREILEDPCNYYNNSGCLELMQLEPKLEIPPEYLLDIPADTTLEEHVKEFIEE